MGNTCRCPTLQSKFGATSSVRNGVKNAFKSQGITAKIDVTHLRASATISIGKAQKMFGTKWAVYHTSTGNQLVALPVNTPKLPKGMKGNVDVVAGMRLIVNHASSSRHANPPRRRVVAHAAAGPFDGGTPTRTGTVGPSCVGTTYPSALASSEGLFPNQILTAYGIAQLQAGGLRGQGARLAIVGEAPDADLGRESVPQLLRCAGNLAEDPQWLRHPTDPRELARRDGRLDGGPAARSLRSLGPADRRELGRRQRAGLPEDAGGAAAGHHQRRAAAERRVGLLRGVRVDRVPYSESRTLVERTLAAEAALGITVVVAAGDTGSSACARGVPPGKLTSADKKPQVSWPASSPYVLAVGGTNLTLNPDNSIASTGAWNDTAYPAPFTATEGWRRRTEHVRGPAVVAARAVLRELEQADGARPSGLR